MATSSSIKCPHCAYNLSGTEGSRCPECGGVFDRDAVLQLDPGARSSLRGVQYPAVALLAAIVGAIGVVGMIRPGRVSHPDLDMFLWLLLAAILATSWFLAWCGMRRGGNLVRVVSAILFTLLSIVYIPAIVALFGQGLRYPDARSLKP